MRLLKKVYAIIFVIIMAFSLTACGSNDSGESVGVTDKLDSWIVTQYTDISNNQSMFYTIHNDAKDVLIVIDGGWNLNVEYVRSIINAHGGHVTAWFITHYHNDHVDAFNALMADLQGIVIDTVYDSPMDYDEYMQVAEEWDAPESFEQYIEINTNNTVHLKRDDVINISDLRFDIYNAYDETAKMAGDIPNNAGLVFKVTGPGKSMLFLSDVHKYELEHELIVRYEKELQADYLQSPHHGSNSFDDYFYFYVNPEIVFIDSPEWMVTNPEYKQYNLIQVLDENGIGHFDYSTAPNSVTLD